MSSKARAWNALAIALGGQLCASQLHAQGAVPADPQALAHSQALIDAVPDGVRAFMAIPSGAVVHGQSGMICVSGSDKMKLAGLLVNRSVAIGDDVGCDYVVPSGKISVFATRLKGRDLKAFASGVVAAIRRTYPDAKSTAGPLVASYPEFIDPIAESFVVAFQGRPAVTSVWIAQEGDWVIEERATYPADARHDPELFASLQIIQARRSIRYHSANP